MEKLALHKLTKTYASFTAVDHIDLSLRKGEFVSLLGPSGCGKTTTLRMIAGFIEPTAGDIVMNGQVLSAGSKIVPPEHRGMSMIFQSYAIWPNMTVFENVAFGLKMRKVDAAAMKARVGKILEIVHLGHLAGRYPNGSPAASSSVWRWRAPSWWSRRFCCSTSRCPISTPTCVRRCVTKSAACMTNST